MLLLGLLATGCAHSPARGDAGMAAGQGEQALEDGLTALDRTVLRHEARQVANCAIEESRQLAREYRVVQPAIFHNFLVNVGLKKRGLCHQWADDLLVKLQALPLSTLEVRWGMARAGTLREHNALIITARRQPFEDGIVLDAWRRSGRLVWLPVKDDHYPWVEGELVAGPTPVAAPHSRAATP